MSATGKSRAPVAWWQTVLVIMLLLALVALAVVVVVAAVRALGELPPELVASIITAFTAVMVAIITAFTSRALERRKQAEAEQRAKRIPVYEEFIEGLLRGLGFTTHKDERRPPDEREMVRLFGEFTEKVIVWGSDDVLIAWGRLRTATVEPGKKRDPHEVLALLEDFLLAARQDLGLKQKKLKDGDLLRLFINDIDKVSPPKK